MKKTIWLLTIVLVAYATFQLMADVGATKMVSIGSLALPGGTFVFAITFTLRDLIHKQLGKRAAQVAVVCSALLNFVTAGYLAWVGHLESPPFYQFDQWGSIFAIAPAISIGSILAEVVSELVDTEVYQFLRNKNYPQWLRVIGSNVISTPIDSVIFTLFAFTLLPPVFGGQSQPFSVAFSLAIGNLVLKEVVGIVSMPLIYLVPEGKTTLTEQLATVE